MARVISGSLSASMDALRRFGTGDALSRPVKIGFIFVAALFLVGGTYLGPSTIDPSEPRGAVALDSAFYILSFLTAVIAFRGWERVFPLQVPTLYAMYPLRGSAVASRELQLALRDGLMVSVLAAMWVIPVAIRHGWDHGFYGILYAIIGGVIAGALAFGVPVLYAAVSLRNSEAPNGESAAKLVANAGPAISFGVGLLALLFLKIGIGEYAYLLGDALFSPNETAPPWPVADAEPIAISSPPILPEIPSSIPNSVVVGLCVPFVGALIVIALGFLTRSRRWLRDTVRVAHAMVIVPELSYAWIDATKAAKGPADPARLLSSRDVLRIHRHAPFRLATTVGLTAVAVLFAVLANGQLPWVVVGLHSAWILLWLRVPESVVQADSVKLREWDALLAPKSAIVRARVTTLVQVCAPYLGLLILPSITLAAVGKSLAAALVAVVLGLSLIAHAIVRRPRPFHD